MLNHSFQFDYGSTNNFKDAFSKIIDAPSTNLKPNSPILKTSQIDTPLGTMMAVADETSLYLLGFTDGQRLERELEKLKRKMKCIIIPGSSPPLTSIATELTAYFAGNLKVFKTLLCLLGSPFQQRAWYELTRIPYGKTKSYAEQATALGKPTAARAVANANGANQIAIVIPCHRIINSNGGLGGYGGGIARKRWLLHHEQRHGMT